MFFTPPQPVLNLTPATVIASVAQPVMAQKTTGSAPVNETEYLLIQGLTNWQHSYTPASAATDSVPATENDLVPKYGFLPAVPGLNQNWSYGTGTYRGLPAGYACLSGSFTANALAAVVYAQRFYTQNGYFFGAACGVTASTWPAVVPVNGALTLWLQPAPKALAHLEALVAAATRSLTAAPPVVVNPAPVPPLPVPTPQPPVNPRGSPTSSGTAAGCSGGAWSWLRSWACGWGQNWW